MASVFSNPCKYAIVGLVHLACRGRDRVRVRDIARAESIPEPYLSKVFQDLARLGLLESTKGPGGGFALGRSPGEISLRQIVEAVDGFEAMETCSMRLQPCDLDDPCPLHEGWTHIQERIVLLLESTSLADLASGSPPSATIEQLAL